MKQAGFFKSLSEIEIPEFVFRFKTILCLFIMAVIGCIWFPPAQWGDDVYLSKGDDWLTYETMAQKILNGDFFLTTETDKAEKYVAFIYPYFIAFVHFIFGSGIFPVYFVQFFLSSVIILCWFKILEWNGNRSIFILFPFFFGITFLFLDLYHFYTERLLSENISVLFIVLLATGIVGKSHFLIQGVLCGLVYLSRIELITFGIFLFFFYLWNSWQLHHKTKNVFLFFLLPFVIVILIYPIRNYLVYGEFRFLPVQFNSFLGQNNFSEFLEIVKRNLLVSPSDFQNRPAAWRGGYFWYLLHFLLIGLCFWFYRIKKKFPVALKGMFVLLFAGTIPYLFVTEFSYAFRYSLPMIFMELTIIILILSESFKELFYRFFPFHIPGPKN